VKWNIEETKLSDKTDQEKEIKPNSIPVKGQPGISNYTRIKYYFIFLCDKFLFFIDGYFDIFFLTCPQI